MFNQILKTRKAKNLAVLLLSLITLTIIIITSGVAYSKYVARNSGTVTAQIADLICNLEVKSSSEDSLGNLITNANKTIINPYCILTVKNYDGDITNPTAVSQTDVLYTITVSPKEENGVPMFTMPQYNWYEIESPDATTGTKVGVSTEGVSGNITGLQAQNKYYKIVFLNTGETDITRYIDFQITAVQDNQEEQ